MFSLDWTPQELERFNQSPMIPATREEIRLEWRLRKLNEQPGLVTLYRQWLKRDCEPRVLDHNEAVAVITELYLQQGTPPPRVLFFSSPAMCFLVWARLALGTFMPLSGLLGLVKRARLTPLWERVEVEAAREMQRVALDWEDLSTWIRIGSWVNKSQTNAILKMKDQVSRQAATWISKSLDLFIPAQQSNVHQHRGLSEWHESLRPAFARGFHFSPTQTYIGVDEDADGWPVHIRRQGRPPFGYDFRHALVSAMTAAESYRDDTAHYAERFFLCGMGGGCWTAWELLHHFCFTEDVEYPPALLGKLHFWARHANALHFWYPYDRLVLCSEFPTRIHLDELGRRLHNPDGAAVEYADGWGLEMWRGLTLPPDVDDPKLIFQITNIEVRRAMMERYDHRRGKGAFLENAGAAVVDSAVQPMRPGEPARINELLRLDLPGDPELAMVALKVIDPSTGRTYILRVPPAMRSVKEALAWTFNVYPYQYKLLEET